ncbi:glucuronate isomerase [Kiritimatiella glycovorans]|uniref:Uronate isomerase n=1 Tax=Kiritimatiella glycovorans TaxID=1307763 RepID=A0A0G3EIF6_9BACT|nr:glucuronate isomerase [Kiritimatiella glycovorans]AKJ63919.1 Uronate isomerase [Kiritimatiella glycovorans]
MKAFMDEDFLLQTPSARRLYHDHAARMPIIDYHCHLPPEDIAADRAYDNLGEAWLAGDHYKWRAMRSNGIPEDRITGGADWREKFDAWAATVPHTLRNPLYHWTHLELQRYFGISDLLNPDTAGSIYERASEMLRTPEFSARNLMRRMNVKAVCTTDDPVDSLQHHARLCREGFEIEVRPAFRPDRAMKLEDPAAWREYLETLGSAAKVEIRDFASLLEAVDERHAFFHSMGCRLSDHGVEYVPDAEACSAELEAIFAKALQGEVVSRAERDAFQAAFLYAVARMNHVRGWAQQFHVGVARSNNSRRLRELGPDTGFDSIGDFRQGPGLVRLLDRLDASHHLARTVLYNINPADHALMATVIGSFQDASRPGKMQWGSAWWFLDHKQGMEEHLNTLSADGLLSRFVGMLTDSRSFLSYPRHEYFRRILCNLVGNEVEHGEIPADFDLLGGMIEDVCFHNARDYFFGGERGKEVEGEDGGKIKI